MESETLHLNLKKLTEERSIWIGVVFVNQRIKAKVFLTETFEALMSRVINQRYKFCVVELYAWSGAIVYAGLETNAEEIGQGRVKSKKERQESRTKRSKRRG